MPLSPEVAVSGPEMAIFWSDKNVNDAIGSSVSVEVSRLEILFSTICIKLASPQAAWLRIIFIGKSVVLHLREGPD